MKLVIWYCIYILGGIFAFNQFANAQTIEFTEIEKKWISEHPTIRVAGGMTSPPIEFIRNGKSAGFSIDYLELVLSRAGLTIEYVTGFTWDQYINKIREKEIDIIHSVSPSLERHKFINFSEPYVNLPYSYFGASGGAAINKVEDLIGRRIGVIEGWITTEFYRNIFPGLNLISYINPTDGLNAVSAGEIDVFIVQLPIGNYIISQNFITGLEVLGRKFVPEIFDGDLLHLGSRKDWPILNDIIKKSAATITPQELAGISQRWLLEYNSDQNIGLTNEEAKWLIDNPIVKVATDADAPPIDFIDENGRVSGISGAYLDIIGEKLNLDFQWIQNKTLAEGFQLVRSGNADVLSAVTRNDEREEYLIFADEYLSIDNVIFAKTNNVHFGSLDAMDGLKVAQVKSFASVDFIKQNYPHIIIVEYNSITEALYAVNDGKVDAYVGSIPSATGIISQEGLVQITVVGQTEFRPKITIATTINKPLLASAIDKAMKSITRSEHLTISKKWLAYNPTSVEDYQLLFRVIGIALVIFIAILFWNYSLRKQVIRRKEAERKMKASQEEAKRALLIAEKANSAKTSFLANMSHEIRTPLNAIIGFSEIISSGLFGKINHPKYEEYLIDINESGKHLARVINDILDLSKIEAGKWQLSEEDFSLNDCINSALSMFKELASNKNINLECCCTNEIKNITIYGDEHCIKRAIINLLSNAIKFTPVGGKVSCNVTLTEDGSCSINIADTGIGIPEDRIEHVINPFDQINENQYIGDEGTGLGLSIVNNLVELHDGIFKILSEEGKGTTAVIAIPSSRITV